MMDWMEYHIREVYNEKTWINDAALLFNTNYTGTNSTHFGSFDIKFDILVMSYSSYWYDDRDEKVRKRWTFLPFQQ